MNTIRNFLRQFTPLSALVFLCALAAFGVIAGLLIVSGHG